MKKLLITSTVFLFSYAIVAQDTNATASRLKPVAGANNLELNFVPLDGKPIQMTFIRYRRFLTDKTAFRLGVGVTYSSAKADSVFDSNVSTNKVTSVYKMTRTGWNLRPGFEKHFEGTNRLSPYIGAELDVAGETTKEVTPHLDGLQTNDEFTIVTERNKNKGGFFSIGANLIAGFDCYITKHLYLGTELGFGFTMINYNDYKKTTDYPSNVVPSTPDPGNPNPTSQGKVLNVGPNFNSAIRLGFIF